MLAGLAAVAAVAPDWRRGLGRLAAIGGIALAVASPWYLRNFIFTGDPIFPFARTLFGLPAASKPFSALEYGLGRDLLHLLSSPFDMLARGDSFDQGWAMGPVYLALAPIGAAAARQRRLAIVLAATAGAWWLVWFLSSPQTRLLLPVLPLAAGLAGVGVSAALASSARSLRVLALGAVGIALIGAVGTSGLAATRDLGVVVGRESVDRYLERNSWNYDAYEAANRLLPAGARVAVQGVSNLYYLAPPSGEIELGPVPADVLRAKGFTHRLAIDECPGVPRPAGERVLWEGNYPLRASRLRGGFRIRECARLSELPPGR
jgi:hypothetical protein